MKIRSLRSIAVVASAALLVGAFAASPAEARRRKKKAPPACAAYTPSTFGSGQPVALVTDAATKDAPVSTTLSTDPGFGFSSEEAAAHVRRPRAVDQQPRGGAHPRRIGGRFVAGRRVDEQPPVRRGDRVGKPAEPPSRSHRRACYEISKLEFLSHPIRTAVVEKRRGQAR